MYAQTWKQCRKKDEFRGIRLADLRPTVKVTALIVDGVVRWWMNQGISH